MRAPGSTWRESRVFACVPWCLGVLGRGWKELRDGQMGVLELWVGQTARQGLQLAALPRAACERPVRGRCLGKPAQSTGSLPAASVFSSSAGLSPERFVLSIWSDVPHGSS